VGGLEEQWIIVGMTHSYVLNTRDMSLVEDCGLLQIWSFINSSNITWYLSIFCMTLSDIWWYTHLLSLVPSFMVINNDKIPICVGILQKYCLIFWFYRVKKSNTSKLFFYIILINFLFDVSTYSHICLNRWKKWMDSF
jgi:hypothetical protein